MRYRVIRIYTGIAKLQLPLQNLISLDFVPVLSTKKKTVVLTFMNLSFVFRLAEDGHTIG